MRILLSVLLLAGCSSFSLQDNLSDAGAATSAAVVGAVNPVAGIVTGIATGVTINTVTKEDAIVEISEVTNVHQEEVAKTQVKADLIESLGREVIIGAGAIFLLWTWLTWFIGARRARPEEYKATSERDVYKRMAETRNGIGD